MPVVLRNEFISFKFQELSTQLFQHGWIVNWVITRCFPIPEYNFKIGFVFYCQNFFFIIIQQQKCQIVNFRI